MGFKHLPYIVTVKGIVSLAYQLAIPCDGKMFCSTDQDAEVNPVKEAMNTTEISMDLKVPSSKAAQEAAVNL